MVAGKHHSAVILYRFGGLSTVGFPGSGDIEAVSGDITIVSRVISSVSRGMGAGTPDIAADVR